MSPKVNDALALRAMLDHFTVFTKGGVVLFATQNERALAGSPVNNLIASVLLEVRVQWGWSLCARA